MFFSRIWIINAILSLFVVFFGVKACRVWIQGNETVEIPEMEKKPTLKTAKPSKALYDIKIEPESKYDVLINRNLFRPERTEITEKVKTQDEKSKALSVVEKKDIEQFLKNLTLYGLVITHDSAEALVSYPVSKSVLKSKTPAIFNNRRRSIRRISAKETKWIKAGDTLGDFKVTAIKPDRVILKAGDQSYNLLLYDKENLKKREPAKPKTGPNVVGVSAKLQPGSRKNGVSAKPNVTNKLRGRSSNAFPRDKKAPNAALSPPQRVLKKGALNRKQ